MDIRRELAQLRADIDALSHREEASADINVEAGSDVFRVPKKTDTGKLREQRRREAAIHVARIMERVYSEEELRSLCYDLGIDYESIEGKTKQSKIRAIVGHFYRRRTLKVFIEFLEGDRPKEVWRLKNKE